MVFLNFRLSGKETLFALFGAPDLSTELCAAKEYVGELKI